MVTRAAFFTLLFLCLLQIRAQSTATLTANNVSATVAANGTLFGGGLEAPKGSGLSTMAVSQLWIGGKTNGNLHIAARLHNGTGNDFWPGPLDTISGTIAGDSSAWNKIYKVSAQEIAYHRTNWNKTGYTMPDGIKHWPGSNPTPQPFKEILAPFADVGGNRIYEPQNGDYPVIKGDEAAYFIINDAANTHFATGGLPMGVEVRGIVWQYAAVAGLENTVFMELVFINRSANNYDSVFAGLWADFALGAERDEYITTYPSKNAFVVYNADTIDAGGYGVHPPAQAVVFLNPPLQQSIEIADDGNNLQRGLPQTPQEFYNYLKHHWRDGNPLTENFNGYQSGNPTNFIYNGDPCNTTAPGWTEAGAAQTPGKRTMLGSVGPVLLNSGAFFKMDVAFVWERAAGSQYAALCKLNNTINDVKAFYNKEISSANPPSAPVFSVYPNPANQFFTIAIEEPGKESVAEIFDLQGRKVAHILVEETTAQISTAHLQAGIYMLKITNNGQSAVQKLVIHR